MATKRELTAEVPSYWSDPTAAKTIPELGEIGLGLSRGDYLDESNPRLGFLAPLTQLNPKATQMAVSLASRDLMDQQKRMKQDTISQLEANNQLTSSVTGNSLADLDKYFSRNLEDITSRAYLADVERSFSNMGNLFSLGLTTTQAAGSLGLQNQDQRNKFDLANFQNQLTKDYFNMSMNPEKGGWMGALQGGLGGAVSGAMAGAPLGPWGMAVGAVTGGGAGAFSGYNSTSGAGAQSANSASFLAGLKGLNLPGSGMGTGSLPGASASNMSFGGGASSIYDSGGLGGGQITGLRGAMASSPYNF